MRRRLPAACLVGLLPVAPSLAEDGWGSRSMALEQGMTEQQVIGIMKQNPDKAEMTTCGIQTPRPWTCKVFVFGNGMGGITDDIRGRPQEGLARGFVGKRALPPVGAPYARTTHGRQGSFGTLIHRTRHTRLGGASWFPRVCCVMLARLSGPAAALTCTPTVPDPTAPFCRSSARSSAAAGSRSAQPHLIPYQIGHECLT